MIPYNGETESMQNTLTPHESSVGTFSKCKNLSSIELPNSLMYIGAQCFQESGLQEIRIPSAGVRAERSAFDDCPAKKCVIFRNGIAF